jgi:hypothetical protein
MDPHKGERNDDGPFLKARINKPDDKTRQTGHPHAAAATAGVTTPVPTEVPSSKPTTNKEAEMDIVYDCIDDMGGDVYTLVFLFGLAGVMGVSIIGFFFLPWTWITAIIAVLIGFVIVSLTL